MRTLPEKILKGKRLIWPPEFTRREIRSIQAEIERSKRPVREYQVVGEKSGNGGLNRKFCDCGKPATVRKNNSAIRDRCNEIEIRMAREMK